MGLKVLDIQANGTRHLYLWLKGVKVPKTVVCSNFYSFPWRICAVYDPTLTRKLSQGAPLANEAIWQLLQKNLPANLLCYSLYHTTSPLERHPSLTVVHHRNMHLITFSWESFCPQVPPLSHHPSNPVLFCYCSLWHFQNKRILLRRVRRKPVKLFL